MSDDTLSLKQRHQLVAYNVHHMDTLQNEVAATFNRLRLGNTDRILTEQVACDAIVAMRDMPAQYEFNDQLWDAVFHFYSHFSGPHAGTQARRALAILAELVQKRQMC